LEHGFFRKMVKKSVTNEVTIIQYGHSLLIFRGGAKLQA
jgi:hypothetical protein